MRWAALPAIAVFLIALAVALRAGLASTNGRLIYALDDAYIHMAMAKNFAQAGVWGCTPFHFSSSSSSPLWTALLGAAYWLFGVKDVVPLLVNVALALGTLWMADRFLARAGAPALLRAATLLALVLAFPMVGMTLMGLEHVLHLLLTLWFAAAAAEAGSHEATPGFGPETLRLCVLGALLGASRYEGFFLVGVACLLFALRGQRLRAALVLGAAVLPAFAFGALSLARGAFFLPNPLVLKAAGAAGSTLGTLLKPFGREDLDYFRQSPALALLLAFALLSGLWHWRAARGPGSPRVILPLGLAALIVLHAHYVFSPTFWVYRYDAYLVGFGLFVAAVVLSDVGAAATPRAPGLVPALGVLALAASLADVREGLWAETEREGMRKTYLEHYQTAEFVRRYYPRETVIVNDLGAVSYYTETRVLDLVGLGDVEPLAIQRRSGAYTSADVQAWTRPYEPKVAIVQLGWSYVAPLVPREWVLSAEVEVPPHYQRVGFFAVDPGQALLLRASVDQHYGPLARPFGYRLKLKRLAD